MKERPILFSSPMVRAILDGRKTQTRRVVRKQFGPNAIPAEMCAETSEGWQTVGHSGRWWDDAGELAEDAVNCPFGVPGDRLWVRETWQHCNHPLGSYEPDCIVFYRADYLDDPLGPDLELSKDGIRRQWRPSIHMPRTAARLQLDVANVRVERLQAISEADAQAEGAYLLECECGGWKFGRGEQEHDTPREAFFALWQQLNGAASLAANPWVWVVEFQRVGGKA